MENGETPAGEGGRRDPTRSEATEEACQFPRRKASCFPANLTLMTQRRREYLEFKFSGEGGLNNIGMFPVYYQIISMKIYKLIK
ncbi:hypothetical protein HM131_03515 [Halobacillus mangrovi]|uniref:Uncharacterized protein n=1 Tax=Halobacillus mangrovi TaxID=402384 RepID=A0A1W5ZRP2_9BACI|nr:hypothetical protein HM131_03515 [Halobacillus mangrovi]